MQDLLSEEDFTTQIPNPWKRFKVFYAVNLLVLVAFAVLHRYVIHGEPSKLEGILVFIAMPIGSAYVMIFDKKENVFMPFRTIILALFLLDLIYVGVVLTVGLLALGSNLFRGDDLLMLLGISGGFTLFFAVITGVILLMVKYKRKKNADRK